MTKEDKELLLKDLATRLPYNTKVFFSIIEEDEPVELSLSIIRCLESIPLGQNDIVIKPYLRPMSSMTEEEKKIMRSCGFELISYDTGCIGFANIENYIDEVSFRFMEEFLNSHHFDYRGLIEEGLALEATENMYKTE